MPSAIGHAQNVRDDYSPRLEYIMDIFNVQFIIDSCHEAASEMEDMIESRAHPESPPAGSVIQNLHEAIRQLYDAKNIIEHYNDIIINYYDE